MSEFAPVLVGRIVEHEPSWRWFRLDTMGNGLRAGDRLRVQCAHVAPPRTGEVVVKHCMAGTMAETVYLDRGATYDIAAIADLDYVYLVRRAETSAPRPEHPLENWIREDAVKVYETTARMPKVAYMVSPADARAIALRAHGGEPDHGRVELHTPAGWVVVVSDASCPLGSAHRAYLCACGALFVDNRSQSGKCAGCMSRATTELAASLGSKSAIAALERRQYAALVPPGTMTKMGEPLRMRAQDGALFVDTPNGSIKVTSDPTVPVGELRMEQTADPTGKSGWGPKDAAAWPGKAMQHAKAVAYLTNRAVAAPEQPTLSARLGHLKHGPGGSGLSGPCDPDCKKCEDERFIAARAMGPALSPSDWTPANVSPEECAAIRAHHGLPPLDPLRPVDWRSPAAQSLAPAKPVLQGVAACHACGQVWGTGPAGLVAHRAACKSFDTYCAVFDPLDVKYDGVDLRELLLDNELNQQERGRGVPRRREDWMTLAQRAAVSAHWSAELRAKVAASTAAAVQQDRARISCDPRDPIDLED